jgi:hypothetical protein
VSVDDPITESLIEDVCAPLRDGHYFRSALRVAGVNVETGEEWLARGEGRHRRGATPGTVRFALAVNQASVEAEDRALARVRSGDKTWQSSAWFLSRRFPARWGDRRLDDKREAELAEAFVATIHEMLGDPEADLDEVQREALLRVARSRIGELAGADALA